jgi:hypothetical protein
MSWECSQKIKLDSTLAFQEMNHKVTEASYVIALEIAKQKKPHTIGEILIKHCVLKLVEIVVGNGLGEKTCTSFTIKQYCSKENQRYGHWHQGSSCAGD